MFSIPIEWEESTTTQWVESNTTQWVESNTTEWVESNTTEWMESYTTSVIHCLKVQLSSNVSLSLAVAHILLLPLFIYILYIEYPRWRKRRSARSAAAHADVLTFNDMALQLVSIAGFCCFLSGVVGPRQERLMSLGMDLHFFVSPGQSLLGVLTCVEPYLAVVHPISYRALRQAGAVRARNVAMACVWLFCFAMFALYKVLPTALMAVTDWTMLSPFLAIVSLFNFSVLSVLVRPRPGDGAGRSGRTKEKAFLTITAVMLVLWLRFLGVLTSRVLYASVGAATCSVASVSAWLVFPGNLLLPLLYLQRAVKLPRCKHSSSS